MITIFFIYCIMIIVSWKILKVFYDDHKTWTETYTRLVLSFFWLPAILAHAFVWIGENWIDKIKRKPPTWL